MDLVPTSLITGNLLPPPGPSQRKDNPSSSRSVNMEDQSLVITESAKNLTPEDAGPQEHTQLIEEYWNFSIKASWSTSDFD